MHFTGKDFKKYTIFILLFIWVLILSHLFYIYIGTIGEEKPIKGGVLIEGVIKKGQKSIINPIPYIGNNYYSKYIQSILFKSCLNDLGNSELCNIRSNDNQTFILELNGDNYWNDGRKITLDDIYFTYNDVIFRNKFGLENPIANNISKIQRKESKIIIKFLESSINNKIFFKNYILPQHKLKGKNKSYITKFLGDLINSTCVGIDSNKSDYTNNFILDYSKCDDYYINKYQFIFLDNQKQVSKLLTGTNKIDLYNSSENIDKNIFKGYEVNLNKRYALFWNTKKQKSNLIKSYISNIVLKKLKENIIINQQIKFNGYGLFQVPEVSLTSTGLNSILTKSLIKQKKDEYEKGFNIVEGKIKYDEGNQKKYFVKNNLKKFLIIEGTLLTGDYDKIGVSANGKMEYYPKSYQKGTNIFKYIISEKFRNIKEGKNVYTIYAYIGNTKTKLDDIIIYYKKLEYPKFEINAPDFNVVYLDKGLLPKIGDIVSIAIKKIYPGKVIISKIPKQKYIEILNTGNYDLVISDINFDGKDISLLFKTNDSISNPSNFVNQNFASLINQNLLAPKNLKDKIFTELNKIYQENIPVVFIGNEKTHLFIRKKYNPKNIDYSCFSNKKLFVKSVVINKIKQPALSKISLKGFIGFLKDNLNNGGR